MTIISVALSSKLRDRLDSLVADGSGANRVDVMRRALELFSEEEAVNNVLKAEREVADGTILRGNARDALSE